MGFLLHALRFFVTLFCVALYLLGINLRRLLRISRSAQSEAKQDRSKSREKALHKFSRWFATNITPPIPRTHAVNVGSRCSRPPPAQRSAPLPAPAGSRPTGNSG